MHDLGGRRVKREIRVYNTLTQEKEVFVPREPGKVSVYVCGVTPMPIPTWGMPGPAWCGM